MSEKDKRLDLFKSFYNETNIVASKNQSDYDRFWAGRPVKVEYLDYKPEVIERIINQGSIEEKAALSQAFFLTDNQYRIIILYYATLLYYYGVLTPQVLSEQVLKQKKYQTQYNKVLNFLSSSQIESLCVRWATKVLSEGVYYGLVANINNDKLVVIDLPREYCRTNYVDLNGNEIIEFNVAYFDKYTDNGLRESILKSYPKYIQKAYRAYKKSTSKTHYYMIPSDFGICFTFFDASPLFVSMIPSIKQYKDEVDIEQMRDLEEIKKIIVQKIPHIATTGDLVFEPDEAEVMHKGAVNMMRGNENVSVLTTYADVDAIVSKTSADTASNNLEKMLNNVYAATGVSGQLFSLAGASSLKYSLNKDLGLMMILARKFANCITNIVNFEFGDKKITYKYEILPIAEYNKGDYVTNYMKLAQSGYSFLMPSIAMGINQKDLITLKTLENDVLELENVLKPLQSSFTQSSSENGPGAPKKENEDKAPKTLENEESLNNQGG